MKLLYLNSALFGGMNERISPQNQLSENTKASKEAAADKTDDGNKEDAVTDTILLQHFL